MSAKIRNLVVGSLIAAAVLALVLLSPPGRFILSMFTGMSRIRAVERELKKPAVSEPVGRTLALYCQSNPPQIMGDWLPKELYAFDDVNAHAFFSDPDGASVLMGGGFYGSGYNVQLDKDASSPETNVWQLSFFSENSPDKHLQTFSLPKTAKVSSDEMLHALVSRYDFQIHRNPKGDRARHGKIQAYLQFDRVPEARQECRDLLKETPDDWWAILVNALLLADEQSFEEGEKLITHWVRNHEDFFRYLDLAYFYHITGKPRQAAAAIVKATDFDANTYWGEGGNSEYRGYTAAMCAYRAGDYEAAKRLCDKLLKVTINRDFAKPGLRALDTASEDAMRGHAVTVEWAQHILPFDPFKDVDIVKLLGHAVDRPTRNR